MVGWYCTWLLGCWVRGAVAALLSRVEGPVLAVMYRLRVCVLSCCGQAHTLYIPFSGWLYLRRRMQVQQQCVGE